MVSFLQTSLQRPRVLHGTSSEWPADSRPLGARGGFILVSWVWERLQDYLFVGAEMIVNGGSEGFSPGTI